MNPHTMIPRDYNDHCPTIILSNEYFIGSVMAHLLESSSEMWFQEPFKILGVLWRDTSRHFDNCVQPLLLQQSAVSEWRESSRTDVIQLVYTLFLACSSSSEGRWLWTYVDRIFECRVVSPTRMGTKITWKVRPLINVSRCACFEPLMRRRRTKVSLSVQTTTLNSTNNCSFGQPVRTTSIF